MSSIPTCIPFSILTPILPTTSINGKFSWGDNFHVFPDWTEGMKITTVNFQYSIAQYLPLIATSQKLNEQQILDWGAFYKNWTRENILLYSIMHCML